MKISSIIGGQKVFGFCLARRETLHQAINLLTQSDTFTEKSTFIQNSLLPLYIDKKSKNKKTVTLFFLSFFGKVTKKSQPGVEHQNFILKSSILRWSRFWSISLGKLIFILYILHSRFYICNSIIKLSIVGIGSILIEANMNIVIGKIINNMWLKKWNICFKNKLSQL